MRHIISISDLSDRDLLCIVERGVEMRRAVLSGELVESLGGTIVGSLFRKTSTRTRTAFTSGALRLGARTLAYGPDELQTNTGETIEDTTRVLSSMLDLLVARTAGPMEELRCLASQDRMHVVNAMNDSEHPTQALNDLTTILHRFGGIEGLRILYVGEGNSTAAALALSQPFRRGAPGVSDPAWVRLGRSRSRTGRDPGRGELGRETAARPRRPCRCPWPSAH